MGHTDNFGHGNRVLVWSGAMTMTCAPRENMQMRESFQVAIHIIIPDLGATAEMLDEVIRKRTYNELQISKMRTIRSLK